MNNCKAIQWHDFMCSQPEESNCVLKEHHAYFMVKLTSEFIDIANVYFYDYALI